MKRLISVSAFLVLIASSAASDVNNPAAAGDRRIDCRASAVLQASGTMEPRGAIGPAASTPERYVVFFDAEAATIPVSVEAILRQAADDAMAKHEPEVRIVLPVDSAANSQIDDTLAVRRVEAVRDALVGFGIPFEAIEIRAGGQADSLLAVTDAMRELYGRRVVVVVDQPQRGVSGNVSLRSSVDM
jgi:OmpA-OmpF porin, OOP family